MKRIVAVILMVCLLLLPVQSFGSQDQYYLLYKRPDDQSLDLIAVDQAIRQQIDNAKFNDLSEVFTCLDLLSSGTPVALIAQGANLSVDGSFAMLHADIPFIANNTVLTIGKSAMAEFEHTPYLLGSSLLQAGAGTNNLVIGGSAILDGDSGLFSLSAGAGLTLSSNMTALTLIPGNQELIGRLEQLLQAPGLLSWQLSGAARLNGSLSVSANRRLTLSPGSALTVSGGGALTLESGASLQNSGRIDGVINNKGAINNQRGAVIAGDSLTNTGTIHNSSGAAISSGVLSNNAGGRLINSGSVTSASILTQRGSSIQNNAGGTILNAPVGGGSYIDGTAQQSSGNQQRQSGGDSDSGGSGGGSSYAGPRAPAAGQLLIAAGDAVALAKAEGADRAVLRLYDTGKLEQGALDEIERARNGFPLLLRAFTRGENGRDIDVRLSLDFSLLRGPMDLSASTRGEEAKAAAALFCEYFDGSFLAVALAHREDFVAPIEVAAKLELGDINPEHLNFYAFLPESNTYRHISDPRQWLDANGFLHWHTPYGGVLMVTDTLLP